MRQREVYALLPIVIADRYDHIATLCSAKDARCSNALVLRLQPTIWLICDDHEVFFTDGALQRKLRTLPLTFDCFQNRFRD